MANRRPFIILVGKSGSGKDYLIKKIQEKYPSIKEVLSSTTREPRYEGEDTHKFVTEEQYLKDKESGNMIAYTFFQGNHYYATKDDLRDADIYILDPDGVKSFKYNNYFKIDSSDDYYDKNLVAIHNPSSDETPNTREVIVVYLHCPLLKRLYRLIKRDGFKKGIKRLLYDYNKFKTNIEYDQILVQKYAYDDLINLLLIIED